jgi:multiple sugar transport system permease protein
MKGLRHLALVVAAIVALAPLVWMVETSLKSNREITQDGTLYPHDTTLENYRSLFSGRDFGSYLTNSIGITALSVLISLVLGSLAAYSPATACAGGSSATSGSAC